MIARNFTALLSAKTLNVQFQSEQDKGVSLSVSMAGFSPMFDELQKSIGMKRRTTDGYVVAFGPNATTYTLNLVSSDKITKGQTGADERWRFEALRNCAAAPEKLVVQADKVQQSEELEKLEKWLNSASKCANNRVVWISADINAAPDTKSNVYDFQNINKLAKFVASNASTQRSDGSSRRLESVYADGDGPPIQLGVYR
jgi:hypothetical protein